jgi:hypothetical protein
MKQVIVGGYNDALFGAATEYNTLMGGMSWSSTEAYARQCIPTGGTIGNLFVELSAPIDVEATGIFTLMLNGNPTGVAVTITAGNSTGSDSDMVAVVAGDLVSIRSTYTGTPGTPTARWTTQFIGTIAGESICLVNIYANKDADTFGQIQGRSPARPDELTIKAPMPTSGTFKKLYVNLNVDPGTSPDAYSVTLRLDTGGGSVNTTLTCTIVADDKTGNDTANTVDVVAGNLVNLKISPLETPSATPAFAMGMVFVSDTNGESLIMGGSGSDSPATGATEYMNLCGSGGAIWNATETSMYSLIQACTIKNLYVHLYAAPGAGDPIKSYTISINKDGGAASGLTVLLETAATDGNDIAHTYNPVDGDTADIMCVPANTPVATYIHIGLVCFIAVPETYTKTVDIDALLKETDTKAVDLDTYLKAIDTKTINLDTLLALVKQTETVDIDALLQALGITKTAAIDALLEATDAKTVNLDVLVKELGIAKTVALDVILGLFASQVDLDVLLRATDTKTVDLDTLIKAVGVVGLGKALSFDGDDYVDCGSGSSLELTGDFTFELWIRPDAWDANANQPFLAKGVSGGVLNWYVGETTANVLKFVHYSDGYKEVVDTSGASWVNGTWYHVVVVVKEASNVVNFYRNGALLSSVGGVFDTKPIITTDEIAQIGRYVSTEYWKGGLIDEVRIYSRALELAEVTTNYNSGKGTYIPSDVSSLVAWWHMDEGSGGEIADSSGEGNTGTIYGATWVGGIIPITTPSLDTLLKAVDTKTVNLDVLIQALGITKTVALDTLIRKLGETKTVDLDALLALVKLTQTVTIDTFLEKTDSKTIDLDVYLRALDVLQTVNLDTLIQIAGITKTVALDALLEAIDTKTVNLDALLKGLGITKTVALDAILMGIGTKTVDLDALIKGITSKTVQLDVIIWTYPTGALGYTIEIRDSSGNPMLDFNLPADDSKATYIVFGNQVWLRNYETGELIKKFLISKRSDTRQ